MTLRQLSRLSSYSGQFYLISSYSGGSGISRIGKLIRLIRLIRLVRISKIYKSLSSKDAKDSQGFKKKKRKTDSKVGRQLSELATKAVIIMCFMLIIILPMFNSDFWVNADIGPEGACFSYKNFLTYDWPTKADIKDLIFQESDVSSSDQVQSKMLAYETFKLRQDFASESNG